MVPADSEMNSSTETPFTNAFPEGWPSCSPTFVVETLQELDKARCPNEKGFYSSYPAKWERLDIEKRQKTFIFFGKLKRKRSRLFVMLNFVFPVSGDFFFLSLKITPSCK